jgi:hypothetical protein
MPVENEIRLFEGLGFDHSFDTESAAYVLLSGTFLDSSGVGIRVRFG